MNDSVSDKQVSQGNSDDFKYRLAFTQAHWLGQLTRLESAKRKLSRELEARTNECQELTESKAELLAELDTVRADLANSEAEKTSQHHRINELESQLLHLKHKLDSIESSKLYWLFLRLQKLCRVKRGF